MKRFILAAALLLSGCIDMPDSRELVQAEVVELKYHNGIKFDNYFVIFRYNSVTRAVDTSRQDYGGWKPGMKQWQYLCTDYFGNKTTVWLESAE